MECAPLARCALVRRTRHHAEGSAGAGALATAGMTAGPLAASGTSAFPNEARLRDAIVASERSSGGRLGVAVLDTGSSARFAYRGDERFPLCSTFKLVLVAAILSRIDRGQERSVRRIRVTPGDILGNSPFARRRVGRDASVVELSRAAIVFSDNSAAEIAQQTLALTGDPQAGYTGTLTIPVDFTAERGEALRKAAH